MDELSQLPLCRIAGTICTCNREETMTIPSALFHRMSRALNVEQILSERKALSEDWVSEDVALKMLGCERAKLYQLKKNGKVRYKAVGRKHQYSRKSIDKHNKLMSS
jgi:hypothetical protein